MLMTLLEYVLYCLHNYLHALHMIYVIDIEVFCKLIFFLYFLLVVLQDKDQRSMDMETARVMLQLLLGKHWPLFTQFAQFLDQSKYKVINKDQWCNILEFSRTINHDLSNYDLDGACEYTKRKCLYCLVERNIDCFVI